MIVLPRAPEFLRAGEPARLDYGNPLVARLVTLLPFNGNTRDAVSGVLPTIGGGGSFAASVHGMGLVGSGAAGGAVVPTDLSAQNKISLTFWLWWDTYANNDALAMEYTPNFNTNSGLLVNPNSSSNPGFFDIYASSSALPNGGYISRPSAGGWHHYAIPIDRTAASTITAVYVDGIPVTFTQTQVGALSGNFANNSLFILSRNNSSLFGAGRLRNLAIFKGLISAREAASLASPVSPLYAKPPRRVWAAAFVAGGSTPIAAADSASGADSLGLAAALALSDAAAGADSLTAAPALALADAASAADAATLAATLALADAAAGSDAIVVDTNTPITLADSATGSDAIVPAVAVAAPDAAVGTDALAVAVTLSVADAGVGADTAAVSVAGAGGTGISPLPYASPYSAGGGALSQHAKPPEPKKTRRLRGLVAKAPAAAPAPAPVPQIIVHHVALADAARGQSSVAIDGWGFDVRPVFPIPRPAVLIRTRPSTRR